MKDALIEGFSQFISNVWTGVIVGFIAFLFFGCRIAYDTGKNEGIRVHQKDVVAQGWGEYGSNEAGAPTFKLKCPNE